VFWKSRRRRWEKLYPKTGAFVNHHKQLRSLLVRSKEARFSG
jgi:hypothetical protein